MPAPIVPILIALIGGQMKGKAKDARAKADQEAATNIAQTKAIADMLKTYAGMGNVAAVQALEKSAKQIGHTGMFEASVVQAQSVAKQKKLQKAFMSMAAGSPELTAMMGGGGGGQPGAQPTGPGTLAQPPMGTPGMLEAQPSVQPSQRPGVQPRRGAQRDPAKAQRISDAISKRISIHSDKDGNLSWTFGPRRAETVDQQFGEAFRGLPGSVKNAMYQSLMLRKKLGPTTTTQVTNKQTGESHFETRDGKGTVVAKSKPQKLAPNEQEALDTLAERTKTTARATEVVAGESAKAKLAREKAEVKMRGKAGPTATERDYNMYAKQRKASGQPAASKQDWLYYRDKENLSKSFSPSIGLSGIREKFKGPERENRIKNWLNVRGMLSQLGIHSPLALQMLTMEIFNNYGLSPTEIARFEKEYQMGLSIYQQKTGAK